MFFHHLKLIFFPFIERIQAFLYYNEMIDSGLQIKRRLSSIFVRLYYSFNR